MKIKPRLVVLSVFLVLIFVYITGPKPLDPEYNIELPKVPSEPEQLLSFVNNNDQKHKVKPNNQAEIIWIDDSVKSKTEYSLLYLHGYTASKFEGEPLHREFAREYGMNAYLARLSDHGIDTSDEMYFYKPDRIWSSAKQALAIASQLGEKVIIMSTSTGGTLALKLASEYDNIVGLINLSPNIHPRDPMAFLLNDPWGLQITNLYMGSEFRYLKGMDSTYKKYWFTKYRNESLVSMQHLVETTMNPSTFKKVTIPVLNIYYYEDEDNQDEVVRVDAIIEMHEQLSTPKDQKRIYPVKAKTHVIGCGQYSKDLESVKSHIDEFAVDVLKIFSNKG